MRGVSIVGLAIVALVLATACGGGNAATKGTPPATPSLSLKEAELATQLRITPTASATPLVVGPDVRICRADDIETAVGTGVATSQRLSARIVLGNRSDTPCQIKRPPEVALLDFHGNISPITISGPCPACDYFQPPMLLLPGLGEPNVNTTLRAGQATLWLMWKTDLPEAPCTPSPPTATEVRLSLPDTEDKVLIDLAPALPYNISPCDGTVQIQGYGPGKAE